MLVKNRYLDDKYVFKLAEIFKDKGWDIEESVENEYSLFDLFCMRLGELESDADRDLIIELTRRYLVVDLDDYGKYLKSVWKSFFNSNQELIKNIDTIHIFPVQDKNYPNKTKSGNAVCYFLQGVILRRFSTFHDKRIRIIETFEGLEKHREEIQCLILVDDYVGSGDTLLSCVNLIEEKGISKEKIMVLTLVLQEYGKNVVEEYGVSIYSAVLKNKAITDNYEKEEVEKKIDQMKQIGKQIKLKDKNLYLGYKATESLVTMIKTPNNTFPFYWYEGRKDGKLMFAPFARRNNVGVDT